MSEKTLTHRDLGRMLGVSETTIKSYRRKFPDCIPVANDGKPIRFTHEAGKVCLRIRELFSRGMSVPEVRTRLEKEFSWIEPMPEMPQEQELEVAPAVIPAGPVEVELPDDYTQALSNLAKSMVNLTMKQDAIARRMESIDARLQKLDLQGAADAGMAPAMEAWMERATALLERLEGLAGPAVASAGVSPAPHSESADGYADEAEQTDEEAAHAAPAKEQAVSGKVIRIRNAYGDVNEYTVETSAIPARPTEEVPADAEQPEYAEPHYADQDAEGGFIFDSDEAPEEEPEEAPEEAPIMQEPHRALLTMPLVIQSPDGEFLGVAGRTRGRFSINDLKAMLMSHFEGSERFTVQWQYTDNGWLMLLEQKDLSDPYSLAVLVDETTTPRGNNVALIEHLTINGKDENPVEMYNFINRIYES
ncbi:helix-turn-helix domain-containing protein [Desulfovibrio subterraneus]|uniref:MerR family transcriptional regulator n=1 Tax=Desulfovibrio subterraneus TaxID=2718620 RepID=UPI0022B9339A|nr:MerR family transcriptional regulator [Desulfovibrio subterraneus]WBF66347.1 helix-turn-helix domain-containing protein [Desulfovibrio subterraneus]